MVNTQIVRFKNQLSTAYLPFSKISTYTDKIRNPKESTRIASMHIQSRNLLQQRAAECSHTFLAWSWTTSFVGELLALVNLWVQMELLSVSHPALIVLNRLCKTSSKALWGRAITKTQEKKLWRTINLHFSELLDSYYSNKHKDGRERDGFQGRTKPGNGDFG